VIRLFLSMDVLCGLRISHSDCGTNWDQAGQLEESGKYWMGRMRVYYFQIRSSESGSPCLCRLRPMSVGPVNQALIMY
jgi:hypothetical protein